MTHTSRALVAMLLLTAAAGACRKKQPETSPTPAGPAPSPTCDQRCRDSIAARQKAIDDSIARLRNAAATGTDAAVVAELRSLLTQKVYFDYDAAELSGTAQATLEAKLPILVANAGLTIRVAGHADERGSDEYNLALGQRRAAVVKRFFTDRGIDAARIEIVSYGEERPEVTDGTEEAFRLNRRAEFEIIAGGDRLVRPR